MSLEQRLRRLENNKTETGASFWAWVVGTAEPNELSSEGKAIYEDFLAIDLTEPCPIEARIEATAND